MKNSIFVQIASYRDPELIPTLKDIIEQAKNPELLRIVVHWQHGDDEDLAMFQSKGFNKIDEGETIRLNYGGALVELIDTHYHDTKGTCWARNKIQQHYDGEDYTLQLDSHHRFIENWDERAINMLESVRTDDTPKPILTGYIPSYDPDNDPKGRVQIPWQTNFDRFIPEGAVFFIPSEMKNWRDREYPQRARFYSGHFCFADGSFAEEIQHDPNYFFHGEEISIAARAFTHGYDLFTPHRIIAWHEYTRKGRTKVWDNHTRSDVNKGHVEKDWIQRNDECHKRNRILFGMDGEDPNSIDFGKYGLGNVRTLREYEKWAGINFKKRGVQVYTMKQEEPPNPQTYATEKEWEDSFNTSVDVRICVHKNEFEGIPDDIDFCFVGVHDKDENEIHRKDLEPKSFYKHFKNGGEWLDYRYICIIDEIPSYYIVWPHSKSKGWLKRIVKPVTDYNRS